MRFPIDHDFQENFRWATELPEVCTLFGAAACEKQEQKDFVSASTHKLRLDARAVVSIELNGLGYSR